MPWVEFTRDHRVQQWDGNGPRYRAGQRYDLERSYADKYVRLGYAQACEPPAAEPAQAAPPKPVPAPAPGPADDAADHGDGGDQSDDAAGLSVGHANEAVMEAPLSRGAPGKRRR